MGTEGHDRSAGREQPSLLAYETAAPQILPGSAPRPGWVWIIVSVYLLVLAVLLTAPLWLFLLADGDRDVLGVASVFVTALVAAGLCLMLVPVRLTTRRPISRRRIWFPIIAAGLLLGLLILAGGMALIELARLDEVAAWVCLGLACAVWAGWSALFGILSIAHGPASIAMKLHRALIGGSVLELLVAVPTHCIVRRRDECCAGIYTGAGICVGVAIMVVSLGPSVMFLYRQRWRQITNGA